MYIIFFADNISHLVVKFTDDESICMIPSKMVVLRDGQSLKPDQTCDVLWTDRKKYVAWILAVGKVKIYIM